MNLLLDSALKATVILLAAWAASMALRRASAEARHLIWLAAILSVAVLPVALSIPQSAIPAAVRLVVPVSSPAQVAARQLPWLLMIWVAGASIVTARLTQGLVGAWSITRSARAMDGNLYSDRAATPMTWGFFRPVVILPAYATQWTEAERELVIRHERAHIMRHDWLWQMLASAVTAVFWFHPLVWLANIQLRREAERAADNLVLSNGAAPADYADRLIDVARRLCGSNPPAVVLTMIRKPELESRVQSILDPTVRRSGVGILAQCTIALAAAALIFPIAVMHAQEKVQNLTKDMTPPSVLYKPDPKYDANAQEARIEGTVKLRVEITTAGRPQNITVLKSLDPGLDANAVEAVSNWKFKPATKDGEPVAVFANIEVVFHLK
jgi:TonB family protein